MVEQIVPAFDVEKEKKRLTDLTHSVLAHAKKCGMDACEISASSNMGLSATVRMGSVETVEFNQDQGFGITVYSGKSKGTASTSDTSEETVKTTVEAACNIARYTQEDDCNGLAAPEKMATEFPDIDLYHPWGLDASQAIEMATLCEQAGRESDRRIENSDGATVSTHQGCSVYGNSHGFIGQRHGTNHSASCVLIAKSGEEMQRGYWYSTSRDPALLESMKSIGVKAAERTVEHLGAKKVKTGKAPVIFQAEVASSLIAHLLSALSGSQLYRDASFLKDSMGKQIFPDWVRIHENPYLQKGLASRSFDGDGLQTREKDFIRDGIISSYILGTYFARKLGMESTANCGGVTNIFMKSNTDGLESMMASMNRGLLVTEFIGSSVNLITGDYSRGVSGFWIENGKIAYPVTEVTIAGNLKEMFSNLVSAGNDMDYRNRIQTGSILIEEMMVGGE